MDRNTRILLNEFYDTITKHLELYHSSKEDVWWNNLSKKEKSEIFRGGDK